MLLVCRPWSCWPLVLRVPVLLYRVCVFHSSHCFLRLVLLSIGLTFFGLDDRSFRYNPWYIGIRYHSWCWGCIWRFWLDLISRYLWIYWYWVFVVSGSWDKYLACWMTLEFFIIVCLSYFIISGDDEVLYPRFFLYLATWAHTPLVDVARFCIATLSIHREGALIACLQEWWWLTVER